MKSTLFFMRSLNYADHIDNHNQCGESLPEIVNYIVPTFSNAEIESLNSTEFNGGWSLLKEAVVRGSVCNTLLFMF